MDGAQGIGGKAAGAGRDEGVLRRRQGAGPARNRRDLHTPRSTGRCRRPTAISGRRRGRCRAAGSHWATSDISTPTGISISSRPLRTDMILVGGANVYPAEIEAALDEHLLVASSAVDRLIARRKNWVTRLHAIIHPRPGLDDEDLQKHLADRSNRHLQTAAHVRDGGSAGTRRCRQSPPSACATNGLQKLEGRYMSAQVPTAAPGDGVKNWISIGARLAREAARHLDQIAIGGVRRQPEDLHGERPAPAPTVSRADWKPKASSTAISSPSHCPTPSILWKPATAAGRLQRSRSRFPTACRLPNCRPSSNWRTRQQRDQQRAARLRASRSLRSGDLQHSTTTTATSTIASRRRGRRSTSGGSTGRPKLIVSGQPGGTAMGLTSTNSGASRPDDQPCAGGDRYKCNGPSSPLTGALQVGARLVLMRKFDAEGVLREIDKHDATWIYLVPTMMGRIWRLAEDVRDKYDVFPLKACVHRLHLAAPCPAWLKVNMDQLAGQLEVDLGIVWRHRRPRLDHTLRHRMAGASRLGRQSVRGRHHEGVRSGWERTGQIAETIDPLAKTRRSECPRPYKYLGATPRVLPGGWESIGDIGWFDTDGYLYLADRRTDMILAGGANIYPAEVEAAPEEHPLAAIERRDRPAPTTISAARYATVQPHAEGSRSKTSKSISRRNWSSTNGRAVTSL